MTALVTTRAHQLANALRELKVKVRAALATELAGAVGTAVRDVLVVALLDRLLVPPRAPSPRPLRPGWRDDGYDRERDAWGEPRDPWADPDDVPARYARDEPDERTEPEPRPAVPAAAAVTVGVNVGRWWLAHRGGVPAAVGFGVLATALGLAGGPLARATLAVLAAAADVLTAESALARIDPS
ncbi:MAG: hypothetical protein ACKODX_23040 [Gemmata sp.]